MTASAGTGTGTHRSALAVLAVSAFVYVTAETLPVGLLPQISQGLSVSEATVGLLLTTYAAIAAVTTIPLTALTMGIPRRRLMAALVAVFAVSQLAAGLAPNFQILTISRLFCALAHGVFWSAIAPVAARLAPPGQSGRATSLVFLGNSLALVLGVPLGTAVGQWAGWRTAFLALAVAGVVSTLALLRVLPRLPADAGASPGNTPRSRIHAALSIIASRQITAISAITTVLVIGQFAAYTYIAPLVRDSGGLQGVALSALLLGYGGAGLLGTVIAGRFVDLRPGMTLTISIGVVAAALLALAIGSGPLLTVLAVLLWGAAFTAVPIPLQSAVLRVAPRSQDAASAVYVVAFQIGIGGGALVGEHLFVAGHLHQLPVLGAVLATAAVVLTLSARKVFPLREQVPAAGTDAVGHNGRQPVVPPCPAPDRQEGLP
jgi:predicted MFS family arabinose efflux permease